MTKLLGPSLATGLTTVRPCSFHLTLFLTVRKFTFWRSTNCLNLDGPGGGLGVGAGMKIGPATGFGIGTPGALPSSLSKVLALMALTLNELGLEDAVEDAEFAE